MEPEIILEKLEEIFQIRIIVELASEVDPNFYVDYYE